MSGWCLLPARGWGRWSGEEGCRRCLCRRRSWQQAGAAQSTQVTKQTWTTPPPSPALAAAPAKALRSSQARRLSVALARAPSLRHEAARCEPQAEPRRSSLRGRDDESLSRRIEHVEGGDEGWLVCGVPPWRCVRFQVCHDDLSKSFFFPSSQYCHGIRASDDDLATALGLLSDLPGHSSIRMKPRHESWSAQMS